MSANLGLVLHHAVMNGSLYSWFNNPASQVSATFWVGRDGTIEQYVDSEVVAWHGMSLNSRYCGVETEGCTTPPYAEPMTAQMVQGLATLYAEGARRHGWADALANADGQRGFGYHRMAVSTACPCDVRLNRRQDILNMAFGAGPTPPLPPTPEGAVDVTYWETGTGDGTMSHVAGTVGGTAFHWWQPKGRAASPTQAWGVERLPTP
jgi:hypothetical protein